MILHFVVSTFVYSPKDMKNLKILQSPEQLTPPDLPSTSYANPIPSTSSTKLKTPSNTKQDFDQESTPSSSIYNITEHVPASVMSNLYGASQTGIGNGNPLFKYQTQSSAKKSGANGKSHFSDYLNKNKKQLVSFGLTVII